MSSRLPIAVHCNSWQTCKINGVFDQLECNQIHYRVAELLKQYSIYETTMELCLWLKSYLLFRNLVFYAFRSKILEAETASRKTSRFLVVTNGWSYIVTSFSHAQPLARFPDVVMFSEFSVVLAGVVCSLCLSINTMKSKVTILAFAPWTWPKQEKFMIWSVLSLQCDEEFPPRGV